MTESDTAWSALRSGCAGQPAFGSSWHRGDVHPGGSLGYRPAGSLKDGPEAFQHACGLGHRDDLRRRRGVSIQGEKQRDEQS